MNIYIATYGSRGDVQPYAALGKRLKEQGHDVTLATSVRFRAFVEELGLRYGYMSDDLLAILDTDQGRDLVENTTNLFRVVERTLGMMKQLGPMQEALLRESWEAAEAAGPDLIIFHPKAYGGPHFAEKLGVPVIMALPAPIFVPTREHPNMGFPDLKLGGGYNRMTYRLVNTLMGWSAGKHVRKWRQAHGLPAGKRFDILRTSGGEAIPVMHGVSRHVIPRPRDWPDTAVLTGYWFLERDEGWTPPKQLADFLAAGPAPVYIGFGSMAGRHPDRLARIAVNALEKSGVRGILSTGWGGMTPGHLPDTILQIDQAPHDWLFPKMAAIVHHGGAGTTAAALRAGKPSVVVPFFGDQPFWGHRLEALGAGSAPIPRKTLGAGNLSRAIDRVLSDPAIQQSTDMLGRKIRNEDGTGNAVSFIEGVMAGR